MCTTCNYTIHRDRHNFGWSRDYPPTRVIDYEAIYAKS